jgi:hypothetical protein
VAVAASRLDEDALAERTGGLGLSVHRLEGGRIIPGPA